MNIPRRHFISGMALAGLRVSLFGQELLPPSKPNAVRFAVIGDMGTGKLPQYEVAVQMSKSREMAPFDFVLMLGDNMYGGHKPSDYQDKFERPYKVLLDAGVGDAVPKADPPPRAAFATVRLYPLPPCTPELQPAEHLWPLVREALANRDFDHLVGLAAKLRRRCDWMADHPDIVQGAVGFHWAVNL